MKEKIKKLFKSPFSKFGSKQREFYKELYSRRFPDGQKQIDKEVEELKEVSKGKLSSDETEVVLLGTAVLLALNPVYRTLEEHNEAQDRGAEYIIKKTNQKLDKEEAKEFFAYLHAKYIKNLKDTYERKN